MPKIVKPMDPVWLEAYAKAEPTLTKAEKNKIKEALEKYNNATIRDAEELNSVLLSIVPIPGKY